MDEIHAHLDALLPAASSPPRRLHAAMRYAALSPGKRLRPLLALAACEAAGGRWRVALPAAAALELTHAFSLVHDDLPAMDDDDYRRGRLTTHKKFGEALGILAGDALLALAFEALAALPPARAREAALRLARAAGSRELVGGQALDLAAEGRTRITARDVHAIHARKTGALMGCALALGAIAGGGSAAIVARFERIGRALGVAFQIHDDLLNLEGSLAQLGKRGGTDAARGKATWPRAVGAARARAAAGQRLTLVRREVRALGPRGKALAALVEWTATRRA